MTNKKQFIILVGVSCMGKTTWADDNSEPTDSIISRDMIVLSMNSEKSWHESIQNIDKKEIKSIVTEQLIKAISYEKNIIIDEPNLKKRRRLSHLSLLGNNTNYERIAIVFPIPTNDEIIQIVEFNTVYNNKFISESYIREQIENFKAPTLSEGFDKIINL